MVKPVKQVGPVGAPTGLGDFESADVVEVADGGTGADNASGARSNLGAGSQADLDAHVNQAGNVHGATPAQVGAVALADVGTTVCPLVLGKVPIANLPARAIPSVNVVADTAARLALTVEEGDEAIQLDDGSQWIWGSDSAWHPRPSVYPVYLAAFNGDVLPAYTDVSRGKILSTEVFSAVFSEQSVAANDWLQVGAASHNNAAFITLYTAVLVGVALHIADANNTSRVIQVRTLPLGGSGNTNTNLLTVPVVNGVHGEVRNDLNIDVPQNHRIRVRPTGNISGNSNWTGVSIVLRYRWRSV